MFIPELTTRVSVKMKTNELDSALETLKADPILGDIPSLISEVEDAKEKVNSLQKPLSKGVADRLSSIQEMIIQSKHYLNGLMSNSVDLTEDGDDWLVGNTASSPLGFPYPLAIEKGTRDHWVEPVTFSALHWGGKPGFFSKGHMVSGIKADPFVEPSIKNTIWEIDEIFNEIW